MTTSSLRRKRSLKTLSLDSKFRVMGSVLVILAHFTVIHISLSTGVMMHLVADMISLPYFIRTRAYDVVIMLVFLSTISMSNFIFK